jgi:hypothetical protein
MSETLKIFGEKELSLTMAYWKLHKGEVRLLT